jgi:hypothetical protein
MEELVITPTPTAFTDSYIAGLNFIAAQDSTVLGLYTRSSDADPFASFTGPNDNTISWQIISTPSSTNLSAWVLFDAASNSNLYYNVSEVFDPAEWNSLTDKGNPTVVNVTAPRVTPTPTGSP